MQLINLSGPVAVAISSEERAFFVELGARIAQRRKAQGITQTHVAEALGTSQQTYNSYETGRRRIPVSVLPALAKLLSVAVDDLLGEPTRTAKKRGPASKLQRQIEQVGSMPRSKQKFITEMLDALIQQEHQTS
jgi:transcriptional regulator with XRE-family HTH domain